MRAARLIATGFGVGYLPLAPGSWASLAALPLGFAVHYGFGRAGLAAAAAACFAIGWWAASDYVRTGGASDPGEVVIDEIAGQWIALLAAPMTIPGLAAAFLLFRLLDIAKPFPIGLVDRRVKGGLGVMLDDALAGAIGAALLLALARFVPL